MSFFKDEPDINRDHFAEQYRHLPDERLVHIATREAAGLTPEALPVLVAEIESRSISPEVLEALKEQILAYMPASIDALYETVQSIPCPVCRQQDHPLQGAWIRRAGFFAIFIRLRREFVIACPACLQKAIKNGTLSLVAYGWIRSPLRALLAWYSNRKIRQRSINDDLETELREYIYENLDEVKAMVEHAQVAETALT